MFDFLKKNRDVKATSGPVPKKQYIDVKQIIKIMQHFPIGEGLQYYPEYNQDEMFDTVVIGYQLNRHRIYTNQEIDWTSKEDAPDSYRFHVHGGSEQAARLETFYLIIPENTRSSLEYQRGSANRSQIVEHVVSDFRRGNSITLVSQSNTRGSMHLDTTVERIVALSEGVYANQRVALLTPVKNGLREVDRRGNARVSCNLSVTLSDYPKQQHFFTTRLRDFSEVAFAVEQPDDHHWDADAVTGNKYLLHLEEGLQGRAFRLLVELKIFKDEAAVLQIVGIEKHGKIEPVEDIDKLMVKSALMQV